jgi:hypothetical protein
MDVWKINWKFRVGLQEPTGVSLRKSLILETPQFGGYTHEHQDTAWPAHCQSLPDPFAASLSKG